jgi:ribosomal protein L39E
MPLASDCIGRIVKSHAKTVLVKAKTATAIKQNRRAATLRAIEKLVLLRDQGIITPMEYERLRRGLR